MIVGIPPFNDDTPELIFQRIQKRDIIEWSYLQTILDSSVTSLINELLQLDQERRPSLEQIKMHPFFEGFQWDKMYEYNPPFKPVTEVHNTEELTPVNLQISPEKTTQAKSRVTAQRRHSRLNFEELTLSSARRKRKSCQESVLEEFDSVIYPNLEQLNKQMFKRRMSLFEKKEDT